MSRTTFNRTLETLRYGTLHDDLTKAMGDLTESVTRRHATGQIVKRPGFPAPCINASQRLRARPTAKVLAYFRGIGQKIGATDANSL